MLFRSALPVHPLCAAIQSIGIVRRDVEIPFHIQNNQQNGNDHRLSYGLGRAILPAILLHGTFDFALFFLGFLANLYTTETNVSFGGEDFGATKSSDVSVPSVSVWMVAGYLAHRPIMVNEIGANVTLDTTDDDLSTPVIVLWFDVASLFVGPVIFLLGTVYYIMESRKQRRRLNAMDATTGLQRYG